MFLLFQLKSFFCSQDFFINYLYFFPSFPVSEFKWSYETRISKTLEIGLHKSANVIFGITQVKDH